MAMRMTYPKPPHRAPLTAVVCVIDHTPDGLTPLMLACKRKLAGCLVWMLEHGADPEVRSRPTGWVGVPTHVDGNSASPGLTDMQPALLQSTR